MNDYELYHHGVKGQKWGVRRFQNADGTLTERGKKKVSSAYKKAAIAAEKDLARNKSRLLRETYNRTADEYNSGKIAEFNRTHNSSDPNYLSDYNNQFKSDWDKKMNQSVVSFLESNKNWKKAESFEKEYGLYGADELATKNRDFIDSMKSRSG